MKFQRRNLWQQSIILIIICLFIVSVFIPSISSDGNFDDKIDQEQTEGSIEQIISSNSWIAQSFRPTLERLTKIELYICRHAETSSNLTVGIRSSLSGIDKSIVSLPASIIPSHLGWVTFDLPDITVAANGIYYIVCRTSSGGVNLFGWYGSDDNPYSRGEGYHSPDHGSTWSEINDGNFDCRFKTYGIGGNDTGLEIKYIVGGTGGEITFGIENIGDSDINEMSVNATLDGGIILAGKRYKQTFQDITFSPREQYKLKIYPVIGIGKTKITISVSTPEIDTVTKTADGLLLLFYVYVYPIT